MKQTLKFLSSVLLISLLGLVNCHKYETGGSPTNGYLVGTYINGLVRSATTGNCAISVNLGSLYAGAIVQGAANSSGVSTTNFSATKFEGVVGSTLTTQGYTATATSASTATAVATAGSTTTAAVLSAISTCIAAGGTQNPCAAASFAAANNVVAAITAANTAGASAAQIAAAVPATAIANGVTAGNTAGGASTANTAAATTAATVASTAYTYAYSYGGAFLTVPYNKKYDAFLTNSTDGTTWNNTTRGLAVAAQKVSTDLGALTGSLFLAYVTALATTGVTAAQAQAAAQAAITAFYATYSTAEKTAMALALGSTNTVTTLDTLVANAATTQINFTGTGTGTFGAILCAAGGGTSGVTVLTGFPAASTCGENASLTALRAGLVAIPVPATSSGTFGTTSTGGLGATINAYLARLSYAKGSALMACARVPRTSCTASSLLTATRDADVASLVNNYQTINATPECRKPSTGVLAAVLSQGAIGLPKEGAAGFLGKNTSVDLGGGRVYTNNAASGGSEGSTTGFLSTGILAEKAYPKSGALLGIASTFTTAHPMNSGTTAYPTATDGSIAAPWYGGSNINVANVTSCDALGLGNYGPTPIKPTDSLTTVNSKKTLTDVKEVVYAFSTNNTVAKAYETAIATTSPITATVDAIACNRQMRKITPISSLLNVGTTFADLNTTSGDGGATSLVTACVYGADSATRTTISALLGSTLPGLDSCPVAAATGASSFGTATTPTTGLTTYTSFPDGQ